MSENWKHIGAAETVFEKHFMPGPEKELVEDSDGNQRVVAVMSGQTVGDAIAKGQFVDED